VVQVVVVQVDLIAFRVMDILELFTVLVVADGELHLMPTEPVIKA
jgi:hypothetical protein